MTDSRTPRHQTVNPVEAANRKRRGKRYPLPALRAADICGVTIGEDSTGPVDCPNHLPCSQHDDMGAIDYHPFRCGANCEVCADR
jgi:hypothetical protein